MENLFVENEKIAYIEVIGDPIYDTYGEDYAICIIYQVSQDIIMQHSIQNSTSTNPIKDGVLSTRMEICAQIQAHHVMVHGIESKSKDVTCLAGGWFVKTKGSTTMIGYMDQNNFFYICFLFIYLKIKDAKFYQWKRRKKFIKDHG
ncbi:hypothetical protein Bca4012_016905 [Brassica carinata]